MKAVAQHARRAQALRQCHAPMQGGHGGMKGGVKTTHLRHACKLLNKAAHARYIVRLMQGRQHIQRRQLMQNRLAENDALRVSTTAMHDAMRNRVEMADALGLQELLQSCQCDRVHLCASA